MVELTLTASTPLDGYHQDANGVSLSEISGHVLVSIAVPLGAEKALESKMVANFGAGVPDCGGSLVSKDNKTRVLGLQKDQMFALLKHKGDGAVSLVADVLGETGYYTDQSDSWAMVQFSGPLARTALERICPLDLHPRAFAIGAVARTTMEHLATIILRDGEDSFFLMSPRSSARSFLHALQTSIENVV